MSLFIQLEPRAPLGGAEEKRGKKGVFGFSVFETHQGTICWLTQSTQYRSFAKLERKYENTKDFKLSASLLRGAAGDGDLVSAEAELSHSKLV
jgi:hypothetical protein